MKNIFGEEVTGSDVGRDTGGTGGEAPNASQVSPSPEGAQSWLAAGEQLEAYERDEALDVIEHGNAQDSIEDDDTYESLFGSNDDSDFSFDSLDDDDTVKPYFNNVGEWVEQWLLPHWRRNLRQARWDERWWEYTEVLSRFESLWRAWEAMRLEGMTGMAIYFRDFLDPGMAAITAPDGPFWKVSEVAGRKLPDTWPSAPIPPGLFDPIDEKDGGE